MRLGVSDVRLGVSEVRAFDVFHREIALMGVRVESATEPGPAGHSSLVGSSPFALARGSDASSGEMAPSNSSPRLRPPLPRFDDVYEQTFDFAWRSARRLGVGTGSIDDVVQDTFVVVHRRLPEFEGRSSLKTWVFGILLRVVSDHRRTLRRKGGLAELPHEDLLASAEAGPAEALEKTQAAALVNRLLEELDDDKRAVFVLAELEEVPAPEIAEVLGVPTNTVYSRLRAAREAFDKALVRHRARERSDAERARAKERP